MRTLIFNGSPKTNGDTEALVSELIAHLHGEVKTVSIHDNISPCIDCRYCWKNDGCCLDDDMTNIYDFLDKCDNIVLASPIWFSSLSGPLLNLTSRIQALWANNYFLNKPYASNLKNGVIIIVGAQSGTETIPMQTAVGLMKYMNVDRSSIAKIYSLDTNNIPAENDVIALERCREVARSLNEICGG